MSPSRNGGRIQLVVAGRAINCPEDGIESCAGCESCLNVSGRDSPAVARLVTRGATPAGRAQSLEKRPRQIDLSTRICREGFHNAAGIGEGKQVRKACLVLGQSRSNCRDKGKDAENYKCEGAC